MRAMEKRRRRKPEGLDLGQRRGIRLDWNTQES